MRLSWLSLSWLLSLSRCCCVSAHPKPHLLVIVSDDLGWNDVSWHGSGQVPVPNLAKLARGGMVLDNYYVQPVCSPTRASLLTGIHVEHTSIYDPDCGPGNTKAVPLEFSMLPQELNKIGYESHAVGKWHLGMFSRETIPTGRGFETFLGYYGGAEDYFTHIASGAQDMHDDVGLNLTIPNNKGEYSTHIYTNRAIEIIGDFAQRQREAAETQPEPQTRDDVKRLFMYLAFQAIHSPDEVPQHYQDQFNETIPDTKDGVGQHRRIVAGMISCLDEGIGNITQALEDAGMLNETLILFTTDNGGPAQGFNSNMASNWPLRGMKRTLWQGGVRGAGFLHGPGLRAPGEVSHDMIHVTDWFKTFLTAAGGDWRRVYNLPGTITSGQDNWQEGDGLDLWATLSTGAANPRTEVLIEAHPTSNADDGNGQAIIIGDLKLILEKGPNWHGPPNDGWYTSGSRPELYNHTVDCGGPPPANISVALPPALFNITADPCEYHDIKDEQPEDYQRLLSRLQVYQKTAQPVGFHTLPLCANPSSPVQDPVDGNWMPVC